MLAIDPPFSLSDLCDYVTKDFKARQLFLTILQTPSE
jgi:hypothetical protein